MPTSVTNNALVDESSNSSLESFLLANSYLNEQQLSRALSYQKQLGGRLEQVLVNLGVLQRDDLCSVYAGFLQLPMFEDLSDDLRLPVDFIKQLDVEQAIVAEGLPFALEGNVLDIAVVDPFNLHLYELWPQYELKLHICKYTQLDILRAQLQAEKIAESHQSVEATDELARLRELAFGAPTVNLVNTLVVRGIKMRASDMHLEPVNGRYRVRYRVDGILHSVDTIPMDLQLGVVSRIKILSGMDIAERRKPQDGKIETSVAGKELDIRVSALPLGEGESIVMRFLLKESVSFALESIGYEPDLIKHLERDLAKTTGVILMTGPTGSGKTTSLYSFLSKVNTPSVKIITLEDPIEYQLSGINQVQVNSDIGFDFARGLRSIVRQDPDIIMVGEIRDQETARIAMQSSLTGHLVFSTVHTNDAPTTFTRLIDLGVEEFLLNASVISVMAQRLVRTLCPHCKVPHTDSQKLLANNDEVIALVKQFNLTANLMMPAGCEKCGESGFLGRVAILEYLPNNAVVQALAKDQQFLPKARAYMVEQGLRSLKQDGLIKVIKGLTTFDEVMRVAG